MQPITLADCDWYHVLDLPGGQITAPAQWDLRGDESRYLGNVNFKGKRVLEIGPASGALSFYMERMGAEVVCIEPPIEAAWDFVPRPIAQREKNKTAFAAHVRRVRNGFWYLHRLYGSNVKVHELSAYHIPEELGVFDIGLMAAMLVHTENPAGIMRSVGDVVKETLIVTDRYEDHWLKFPMQLLMPRADNQNNDTWWEITPEWYGQLAAVMGFDKQTFTPGEFKCCYLDRPLGMMTMVARK